MTDLMQIGQVAERTALSLRTIRWYEQEGLVVPARRTEGGFRLYDETAVAKLMMIRRMKPLGFTLDQMRDVLDLLAALDASPHDPALRERLRAFHTEAVERVEGLQLQLAVAEDFANGLAARLR